MDSRIIGGITPPPSLFLLIIVPSSSSQFIFRGYYAVSGYLAIDNIKLEADMTICNRLKPSTCSHRPSPVAPTSGPDFACKLAAWRKFCSWPSSASLPNERITADHSVDSMGRLAKFARSLAFLQKDLDSINVCAVDGY